MTDDADDKARRIVFNVSGRKFEVDIASLSQKGTSKLQQLALTESDGAEIFINRPSNSFEAVLAYHQTGELHMPPNTCPAAFQAELKFYELDSKYLAPCCFYNYSTFLNNRSMLERFHKRAYPEEDAQGEMGTGLSRWQVIRNKIWKILDDHNSSILAKVYLIVLVILILLSVLILNLNTVNSFRRPLNIEEKHRVAVFERAKYGDQCISVLDRWLYDHAESGEILNETCSSLYTSLNRKTIIVDTLWYIDLTLLCIFTIEFLVRIIFCPSVKKYFKSWVNILDAIALVGSLTGILINNLWSTQRYELNQYDVLPNLQVLRAVRLLRVMKNLDSSKVLGFVFWTGFSELGVMLTFLCIGMLIFSNLIFFMEDRDTMPDIMTACWWAIVTMTTVGFGDIVPHSVMGRLLGMVCAICGVVLIAITIPIFVNTFVLVYNYSKFKPGELRETRKKSVVVYCNEISADL